jgi:tyrosyl-tRNA synthetase
MISIDEQIHILRRRCDQVISVDDLRKKLERSQKTGKPLRIKLGLDPTAPDVTLGHCVPLKVVRQFQEWGHKAVLIIGDYTARVGDPSGRNELRPMLTGEQIDANAKTYVNQLGRVLLSDPEHLEVRFNGEWLAKMNLVDIIRLAARKSLQQVMHREDFAKRFAAEVPISLHELLYPLLQGWDSVMIDADVEMGGLDQLVNNLVGREFQQEDKKDGQVVIVTPLLVGTDGAIKMSKSKGNYIAVTDPPSGQNGIFGKVMSLPDSVMEMYYTLLTDLPMDDVKTQIAEKPRDAKIALAKHIIAWLYSAQDADAAEAEFIKVFSKKEVPDEMPEFTVGPGPHKVPALIVTAKLANTNSEAIRKIREGAVSLNGQKIGEDRKEVAIDKPTVLKLGRKFARLKP